jgi:hypothetical protein
MSLNDIRLQLNLFENGLDFILSALNYLKHTNENDKNLSNVKYAVLHMSAGVELILKYRLSLEHWSLLFSKIEVANIQKLKNGDFQSVDSKECITRLENICGLSINQSMKESIRSLRDKRNKLEHFEIDESVNALKSSLFKVLNPILDFIHEQIPKDDLDEHDYLLKDIRSELRDIDDFIKDRMEFIKEDLDEWKSTSTFTTCPHCYQTTLCVNEDFTKCFFCGYSQLDRCELANEFIWEILNVSEYECITQGGEYPLYRCIECGEETLVYLSLYLETGGWICFNCGIHWDVNEINFCVDCNEPFYPKYQELICRDCLNSKLYESD